MPKFDTPCRLLFYPDVRPSAIVRGESAQGTHHSFHGRSPRSRGILFHRLKLLFGRAGREFFDFRPFFRAIA
jgi:hypothetical protein